MRSAAVRWAAAAAALVMTMSGTVRADEWNDKTTLTFSGPVIVPGATLPAGSYVFKLADTKGNRQLVQVFDANESRVITTTQAIPVKREEVSEDVVLRFNPTDTGTPVAIKAWFPPGSRYGHEFIYPEEQARTIAERTKTVVLSIDVPGSELERGVLRLYDPSGSRTEWRGDEATLREWETWRQGRATATRSADTTAKERRQGTAPVVRGDFEGMRVKLDELETNPQKYIGQRISVDAEVEEVFGPRLFTIDEPNWGDLDGEILVFVPTELAALVNDDDRITITGTVRPFVRAEVEREWGWLGLDPEVEVEFGRKPVLVAERVVGGNNDVAVIVDVAPAPDRPRGTSGASAPGPISDAATLASGDQDLVGRPVALDRLRVAGIADQGGFFVASGNNHLFVLLADAKKTSIGVGDTVSLQGYVMRMPRSMDERLKAPGRLNDDIYVYATGVTK